jgi:iron complex transport system substrate-binding protein
MRVASLLASSTEILYGLGLGESVVAVSHECDYPDAVRTKPRVTFARVNAGAPSSTIDEEVQRRVREGRPLYEIDVQRLKALRPDLIVTQSQCDVCAVSLDEVQRTVDLVEDLRHARIVSLNPMTLEGVFEDIRRVGESAGVSGRAADYVAGLRRRNRSNPVENGAAVARRSPARRMHRVDRAADAGRELDAGPYRNRGWSLRVDQGRRSFDVQPLAGLDRV